MSAQATAAGTAPDRAMSIPRVPFSRLVRVEVRKMYDTRAGLWLLIAIGGITFAAAALFLIFGHDQDLTFENFTGVSGTPQGFLLPVLGILAVTSEWSQRTGLTTFTLEPHRGRALAAKMTAVILMGLIAVVLIFVAAALCNVIGIARGGDGSWDYGGVQGYADVLVGQMLGLLAGLAFGTVLLISAAAITLNFVLPLVSSILFNVIPGIKDAGPWIDAGTAQQPLFQHEVSAHEWAQIVVTSLWWVWIPLAVGVWRVLRTEIKSA